MLTNTEMAQLFIDAEPGFVYDLEDNAECNSGCDECPAQPACEQLAEDNTFTTFVKNYNRDVLPLIREMI